MILNFWSQPRENKSNFPYLNLDSRYSFVVGVRKFYFELSRDETFQKSDLFYLKSDLIDLTSFNLSQSILNFGLENNENIHYITPAHISYHSLASNSIESPSFEIYSYRGDRNFLLDYIFLELEIKRKDGRIF